MSQVAVFGFLGERAVASLTPIWLVGVGALAGVALVTIFWLVLSLVARFPGAQSLRQAADETWISIREGVLFYSLIVALTLAALGIVGTFTLRPVGEAFDMLGSLARLPAVGMTVAETKLPAAPEPTSPEEIVIPPIHELAINFRGNEIQEITVESDENLSLSVTPDFEMDSIESLEVKAEEPYKWRKRPDLTNPLGDEEINTVYLRNRGYGESQITFTIVTDVIYPQVRAIPITALAIFSIFFLYFLQASLMPRLSAVSLATFKSEVAQPLFLLMLVLGIVALVLFIYIPYNTFGEDIKVLKDSGLTLIRVLTIILAVWGASSTIADEIDGKTALTVLSKPIGRRSFVIGKFLGITWTTALMYIVLGTVLLAVVSYKVIYDARESAEEIPAWTACYAEMVSTVPGLILAFMETLILASLSVAMSTRLPLFGNFLICFTVYVLGHLVPLISQATLMRFEIVKFFGQLISAVFPNLEAFDIQSAIAGGLAVPYQYLAMSALYCLLFSLVALLLALIMFEDRDLA